MRRAASPPLVRLTAVVALLGAAAGSAAETRRPNVVMVVVDDMRFDEYAGGGHPYLETPHIDRLAAEGATFTRAYHATPLCSPNRASLLTGQYASRHGILDNTSRSRRSRHLDLFPKELQAAGYRTGHVGKWHMGNDPTPRPGYDYWVSFAGQGRIVNPVLWENGGFHEVQGYVTDVFTDRAVEFIRSSGDQPFFLYVGHKAIHPEAVQRDDGSVDLSVPRAFLPAPRHAGRYREAVVTRRPNYGLSEQDALGKPVLAAALEERRQLEQDPAWVHEIDPGIAEDTIRARAEMMLAVDEGLGRILAALEESGRLDDTLVVFTSDNGYFYGEHGLTIERRLPYEESVRTPLLVRYPPLVAPGTVVDALVSSIDVAPTVLEIAGVGVPASVQGRSLAPLLGGEVRAAHEAILIEFYGHENPFSWTADLDYRVVCKGRYKLIRWIRFEDQAELYDIEADPYELHNRIADPELSGVVADLEKELKQLALESLGLEGQREAPGTRP